MGKPIVQSQKSHFQAPAKNRIAQAIGRIALALPIAGAVSYTLFFGVSRGPTLIDEIRSGIITENEITKVEVLKPGVGWDFTEAEYDRRERVALPSETVGELVDILKSSTTDGEQHRAHPSGHYRAILKFHHQDGRHYYLLYKLHYYHDSYYLSVTSLSAGSTNPNGKRYENVPLVHFLGENDPWWLSDSEPDLKAYRSFVRAAKAD